MNPKGRDEEEEAIEEANEEEANNDNNEEALAEQEAIEDAELPDRIKLDIEMSFKGKDGKVVGRWFLSGFAASDERLYVTDTATVLGEAEDPPLNAFSFEDFSDDFQDRIYDYLDEMCVDDQLAQFARDYCRDYSTISSMHLFDTLKKLFSA
eukprot:TRINITY_DN1385_c0_g1_i1.p1 TRINITY_DN1385_c0_g1~~TRINITY_DN1385_c0_g1_i1.p1  ORF type:complete len:152 (+),score=57.64 TRINITY_DN1385_c0_g1_i1:475-930(+)